MTGTLVDASSDEPIIEAQVLVIDAEGRTLTDVDGNFTLNLPPGTYTLRSFYDGYQSTRLENIEVRAGELTRVTFRLPRAVRTPPAPPSPTPGNPSTAATPAQTTPPAAPVRPRSDGPTQEVVVRARADRNTAATQIAVRRQSASVSDSISAQEIARTPDSNAGEAARRLVGVTVPDRRCVFVRGLGNRYVNVLLNGAPMPSLDPDVPCVQLDLLPAPLLTALAIHKSFTPDMPGDFVGGSLQITTRDFPQRLTLQASFSMGMDSLTQTSRVLRGGDGSTDLLGVDDGTRTLPRSVPGVRVESGQNGLSAADVTRIGRGFSNNWSLARDNALPNLGVGLSVGNTTRLAGRPLGYLFSLNWSVNDRRTTERVANVRGATGSPDPTCPLPGAASQFPVEYRECFGQESFTREVAWAALGNLGWRPSARSEIQLIGLWSQNAEDASLYRTGYSETVGSDVAYRLLRWTERSLGLVQLSGDHRDFAGRDWRLRWLAWGDIGRRSEPDTRELVYSRDPNGFRTNPGPGNTGRLFSDLDQREVGANIDVQVPLRRASVRVGAMGRYHERVYALRRFSYQYEGPSNDRYLGPEEFYAPSRLGDDLRVIEYTDRFDGYEARQDLVAPFVRGDLPVGGTRERPRLRFSAGVRLERFGQRVRSRSPFARPTGGEDRQTERTDLDLLPSASGVWSIGPRSALRLAYSGTVARPLVRELAPFVFPDFVRNRTVQGNPALQRTFVHSVDLRWEFFPSDGEVLAVTTFGKFFRDPIESVVLDRNGNITFDNVAGADNLGVELEARLSLGRIHRALRHFAVNTNLSLIYSRVRLSPEQQANATSAERPMAGQAPWIVNASFGWLPTQRISTWLSWNVFGPTLEDVGRFGLPDSYREPQHSLDAVVSWEFARNLTLRVVGRNLAHQPLRITSGGLDLRTIDAATGASMRLAWTY